MSYLLGYNPGTQQWGYPRRGGAQLSGTIIVHTAECAADNVGEDTSAEGCARMIANRADYGSYHRLVDSDSIIDMLPWEYEAWQDSETNNWAVGISAALRTSDWAVMPADRRDRVYRNLAACAADFVRYMAGKGVTVPLRRISGAEARARVPGFCAHGDSGIARSDPGANFDWALFFAYTQAALDGSLTYASTILGDDMATVPQDEWTLLMNIARSLSDNAATKKDLRDVVEPRTMAPNEKKFTLDVLTSLADNVATKRDIETVAGDVAKVAAQAASGGASVEQITEAVKQALVDGINVTVKAGD